MATAKKVKNNTNKKKNSKAWQAIKLGLSGLINNDSVISLSKTKWYGAVIAGVLSCLVAVIPTLVNYSKLSGSDILSTPSGGLTNGLISFAEDLDANDIDVIFNADKGEIEIDNDKWNAKYPSSGGYHVYTHTYTVKESIMQTEDSLNESSSIVTVPTTATTKDVTLCDLVVYNLSGLEEDAFTNTIFGDKNGYTYTQEIAILKGTDPTPQQNNPYTTTTLFLGKNCFALIKSPNGRNVSDAAAYKLFKYEGHTVNLRNFVKENSRGEAYEVPHSAITEANYQKYLDAATASWETLFNDSWKSTRNYTMWTQTAIWLSIYIGVTFFMGLMIFVITRGKANPNNTFTFWQSQKASYWAAITPAILGLIMGFWITRFAMIGYLIFFAIRILWMSFRTLRPRAQ